MKRRPRITKTRLFTALATTLSMVMVILLFATGALSLGVVKTIPVNTNHGWNGLYVTRPLYHIGVNQGKNKVYMTQLDNSSVFVIDGKTNTVIKTLTVSRAPDAVCANPNTNKIYVAHEAGQGPRVTVIDDSKGLDSTSLANVTIAAAVGFKGVTQAICVNPVSNKVYISNKGSDYYGSGGSVSVLDGSTDTVVKSIPVGRSQRDLPAGICVNPDPVNPRVYVLNALDKTISVIDGKTDTVTGTLNLDFTPTAICYNKVNNRLYVGNLSDNTVVVLDAANGAEVTSWPPTGYHPSAIDVNTKTNKVFVTNTSDWCTYGTVGVLDANTESGQKRARTVIAGGGYAKGSSGPGDVAVNSTTCRAYVANEAEGSVTVIYDPPDPGLYMQQRRNR